MMRYLAFVASLAFIGCTAIQAPIANPRAIWCSYNLPHNYSNATLATFDRSRINDENDYQDTGIKWCGWKVAK